MNTFSSKNRNAIIDHINKTTFDLIIIGGGITGAGILLDATSRGLKTLLLEKNDFASGTSSKSTKLIHGGLRYLKQFEIGLVREVGKERAVVHKLARHLVHAEKMVLPIIKNGTYGKFLTSLGLMIYDILASVKSSEKRKMLSKEETLNIEPLLNPKILKGGSVYVEYRTDDARLTIEILKTALKYKAIALNHAKVEDFIYQEKKISGLIFKDELNNTNHTIKSKNIINATGTWVDTLRNKDASIKGYFIQPTKGIHLVFPKEKFPIKNAIYFDIPDGRMLFAIPRDDKTYVGTTDTYYNENYDDIKVEKKEVNYLIQGVNTFFPSLKLSPHDIESTWAGLRPLIGQKGKSASEVSRKDEIFESKSGLLSIAGGKLTGYRKMAKKIVDKIAHKFDKKLLPCYTDKIYLEGSIFHNQESLKTYIQEIKNLLENYQLEHYTNYLVHNYGKNTHTIIDLFISSKNDNIKDNEIKLCIAELKYCLENESVFNILDFFERRTGRLYFKIDTIKKTKNDVIQYMANYFQWDNNKIKKEEQLIDNAIKKATLFID